MTLEQSLKDLRSTHIVPPSDIDELEFLMELIWDLTDLEEIDLPPAFDGWDDMDKYALLRSILIEHIRKEILSDYIARESKKRVAHRHDLEAKGEHIGTIG